MVFSSISFIFIFLPAVLAAYYLVPKQLKNPVLLVFSLLFYYIGEQKLTVIMIASTLTDYFCSLGIEHFRKKRALTKLFLGISLLFNLSLLGYFKYAGLLIKSFNGITGADVPLLKIALPIGISFYTFQTMSYTIDVYRGKFEAQKNLLDFAVYVTLFPQLIAGPIVRYEDVKKEIKASDRKVDVNDFAYGVRRFCIGLGKKVLLANTLAELSQIYDGAKTHTAVTAWICAIAVPLQIYFDFSGYSDMAIGLGRMFGFHFIENFNYPVVSKSASEFWRRWHMTLGSWFKDYVYIPLKGSRCKPYRNIINLLAVWLATGLWHGASYNFILWGLFYGILIILEKYVYGKYLEKSEIISRIYFFIITVIGFEIFSADSLSSIGIRIGELFGVGTGAFTDVYSNYYAKSYLPVIIISVICALPFGKMLFNRISKKKAAGISLEILSLFACMGIICVCTGYLVDGSYNPFLYFRF